MTNLRVLVTDGPEETHNHHYWVAARSGILVVHSKKRSLRYPLVHVWISVCIPSRFRSGYMVLYIQVRWVLYCPLFKEGYDVTSVFHMLLHYAVHAFENCPVAIPLHELMEHRHSWYWKDSSKAEKLSSQQLRAKKMFRQYNIDLGTTSSAIGMNLISNKESSMPEWILLFQLNGLDLAKSQKLLGSLKFKKFRDLLYWHEKQEEGEK